MYPSKIGILLLILFALVTLSCQNNFVAQNQSLNKTPLPWSEGEIESLRSQHFHEAIKMGMAGEPEKAVAEMRKAIELKPDAVSYNWIAQWCKILDNYECAEDSYRKILDLDPKDIDNAQRQLAIVLIRNLHRYDEGLKHAKLAAEIGANTNTSFVDDGLVAEAFEGLGDRENALIHYRIYLRGWCDHGLLVTECIETKKKIKELETPVS